MKVVNKKKLYVGNLPYQIDTPALHRLFAPFGEIRDVIVIKDRQTQRSRGFGFVSFATEKQANLALLSMQNAIIEARPLRIKYADNKQEKEKTAPEFFENMNTFSIYGPTSEESCPYPISPPISDLNIPRTDKMYSSVDDDDSTDLVTISLNKPIALNTHVQSELIRAIVEEFGPRFAPGSLLLYARNTNNDHDYYNKAMLTSIGIDIPTNKMPDVILHFIEKNWLLLVESVTSHGLVDAQRHAELANIFSSSTADLVYVAAFPNRSVMGQYLCDIAWETEVWVADAPSHLIHFNGTRFLGPYAK
jgi:hypothetical protein